MDMKGALDALGVKRVIWVDDIFKSNGRASAKQIFALIDSDRDAVEVLGIPGLDGGVLDSTFGDQKLSAFVEALDADAREEIWVRLRDLRASQGQELEVGPKNVGDTAKLLGIADADKWSFEQAVDRISLLCKEGDAEIAYIVDLSNGEAHPREGLNTLHHLHASGSRGTIFILTHDATIDKEADLEADLRREYRVKNNGATVPAICVISKSRISDADTAEVLTKGLMIAVKRAGLRRSVHAVLSSVRETIQAAYDQASDLILDVPPEQLDRFIVERGYKEGVSELHVVERAIAAKLSDNVRTFFAANPGVRANARKLRDLRSVDLGTANGVAVHRNIQEFRRLEIWESSEQVNRSLSPLSCGDVFVLDPDEFSANDYVARRFILLGQPCDIQIRDTGKRDQQAAYLLPLSVVIEAGATSKLKNRLLPFTINGEQWACDFRNVTLARLNILDLATFREDGKVAFSKSQAGASAPQMLHGMELAYASLSKTLGAIFDPEPAEGVLKDFECQLAFSSSSPFNRIVSRYKKESVVGRAEERRSLEARVTWSLKREGRVRMPYSASLLRDFLAMSGREAFDMDFTSSGISA